MGWKGSGYVMMSLLSMLRDKIKFDVSTEQDMFEGRGQKCLREYAGILYKTRESELIRISR